MWFVSFCELRCVFFTTNYQEIHPNSPAAQAGLIPHTDYILGSDMMVSGDDDLYSLVENNNHKEIKLYVYNSEMDRCREVSPVTMLMVYIHVHGHVLVPNFLQCKNAVVQLTTCTIASM